MAQSQQRVEAYKGQKAYQAGVNRMAKQGWRVVNTVTENPRTGLARFIMLGGIGALVWRRKTVYTVTFAR